MKQIYLRLPVTHTTNGVRLPEKARQKVEQLIRGKGQAAGAWPRRSMASIGG